MTTHTSHRGHRTSPGSSSSTGRTALIVLGVAILVVGVLLLFNVTAAARTLALLIGLALVLSGCLELAAARADGTTRWGSALLGVVLVIGGLVAAFWPGITLWFLAVITGVTLIVHGAVRVGIAVTSRATLPGWGWLALAGAVNVIVGALAIVWPQATVFVLSLLLGVQVLFFGGFLLIAGLLIPRSTAPSPR
jgi:uncharacterized membrane protein HdeD (DUF308 family)